MRKAKKINGLPNIVPNSFWGNLGFLKWDVNGTDSGFLTIDNIIQNVNVPPAYKDTIIRTYYDMSGYTLPISATESKQKYINLLDVIISMVNILNHNSDILIIDIMSMLICSVGNITNIALWYIIYQNAILIILLNLLLSTIYTK